MTAILTKHIPATNNRPTRIKIWAGNGAGSMTLSENACWDGAKKLITRGNESEDQKTHRFAAELFRDHKNWYGRLIGGSTKEGYAFVFAD